MDKTHLGLVWLLLTINIYIYNIIYMIIYDIYNI